MFGSKTSNHIDCKHQNLKIWKQNKIKSEERNRENVSVVTGLEEMTVEEKRPREGRLARNGEGFASIAVDRWKKEGGNGSEVSQSQCSGGVWGALFLLTGFKLGVTVRLPTEAPINTVTFSPPTQFQLYMDMDGRGSGSRWEEVWTS